MMDAVGALLRSPSPGKYTPSVVCIGCSWFIATVFQRTAFSWKGATLFRRLHQGLSIKDWLWFRGWVYKMLCPLTLGGTDFLFQSVLQRSPWDQIETTMCSALPLLCMLPSLPFPECIPPIQTPSPALFLGSMLQDNSDVCILFSFDS